MNLDDIELHDALLKGMHVDYASRRISIAVQYYETTGASQRVEATLEFEGVDSISQIADCECLERNAFAGNVNYWVPRAKNGTTFIYLTDGCISVNAKQLWFTKPTQ